MRTRDKIDEVLAKVDALDRRFDMLLHMLSENNMAAVHTLNLVSEMSKGEGAGKAPDPEQPEETAVEPEVEKPKRQRATKASDLELRRYSDKVIIKFMDSPDTALEILPKDWIRPGSKAGAIASNLYRAGYRLGYGREDFSIKGLYNDHVILFKKR